MLSVSHSLDVDVVGTERLLTETFSVSSIKIDNPSGMWLYVVEVGKYVPSNQLGWISNISPATNSIHIQYVEALVAGTPSLVDGGPIAVTNYEGPQTESYGLSYAAATAADVAALQASIALVQAAVNDVESAIDLQSLILDLIALNTNAIQSSFAGGTITATSAAAQAVIADATAGIWVVALYNEHATETDYYGPSSLTTTNGFPLLAGEKNSVVVANGVGVYVRNSGGTAHDIRYLLGRVDQ